MIQLASGATFSGKAGTNSAISYHVEPDTVVSGVDDFTPSNGQLTTSTATMFTATGGSALIKSIQLTNTAASPVTGIVLYRGGTTSTNQIVSLSIVANGTATYEDGYGWQTYDGSGNTLGGAGIVTSVTAADGSITVGGTSSALTVSRAALTGDVTASAGSNATTLAAGSAGNLNSGTLLAARMPALTGDTTTTVGTVATTVSKINGTSLAGLSTGILKNTTATGVPSIAVASDIPTTPSGSALGTGRTLTTTAPLTIDATTSADLSANRTLAITAASASNSGSQSATQFSQHANYFGHIVYNVEDYGVLPGNSATTNVTNMNTLLQTTAVDGAIIQFGPYTYSFNAGLTVLAKDFCIQGVYGQTTIAITADMTTGVPFIKMNNTGFYTCVQNLNFVAFTAAQTANYVIMCQNNANPQIINCFFTGAVNWAGILDFTGTNAGNGAVVRNLYCSQFTGIAINVSSPLDTMYIEDSLILGGNSSTNTGIFCDNGGAMLLSGCQIIGCGINVNLTPATGKTVSAVYATNCFFDQGIVNCLKISGAGTGTVARCHFVGCWFTPGITSSSPNCILINSSGTGIHSGIEFQCSWIMNAPGGGTGTLTGVMITAGQDITINNCQMAGWTTAIDITPPTTANVCSPLIVGNNISPAGLIGANTNGIILRAGAPTTYGYILISGNQLQGNTTAISDSSTVASTGQKLIQGNTGLVVAPATQNPNLALVITTVQLAGVNVFIPAGVRVGTKVRIIAYLTNTASAQTLTPTLHFGTAGTNADASVAGLGLGAGTAALGGGVITAEFTVTSATTAMASIHTVNSVIGAGGTGAAGLTNQTSQTSMSGGATPGPATIATTSNSFLGLYFNTTVGAVVTVRTVAYEVTQQ